MSEFKNLIGGEWVSGAETTENRNPSDVSDIVGLFAKGNRDDVNRAVDAASTAFTAWSRTTPQARHDLLDAVGNAILSRKEEFGRLLSREEGKTLAEGVGETVRAGQVFKFFAGEALRMAGEKLASVRPGVDVDITREPLGVVGIITPWNFPIAIPAWKIAPALAFGNCVVFKPAGPTLGTAHVITSLLKEFGCPDGVVNLVMGSGAEVGEAILDHPDIAAISFTGSAETGHNIAVKCAQTHKKVQLEMGGKNPMVIMDDADLSIAVPACINGAFYSTGQRCTASSRLIVHEKIHDAFVESMKESMEKLVVGDALDEKTSIGPVIDESQLMSNLKYVEVAKEEGADVIGGEKLSLEKNGYYQAPALFLKTHSEMRINREEIFGPCASVIKVDDFDEAVAVANDTDFGLSAGICTGGLKYASEFKKRAQAGVVMVNLPTAGIDYHTPFGGRKKSSYGPKEQGRYAVEFYTMVKTSYTLDG